ncbi:MAG: hypothetical protein WC635_13475 [Bacteriovorax sp.]|jgi:hypothetical protein
MKKIISLLGIMFFATSCLNLEGNLRVHEAFNVKKKGGFLNRKLKDVTLTPSTYRATLKMKSDKKLNLEIKDFEGKDITLPIKSDEGMNLPSNGKFAIGHEKIGQPFDVVGVMKTDVNVSDTTYNVESCSWTETETRCERRCTKDPLECHDVCEDITITHEGHQDVAYHYVTTTRNIGLDLMRENSTSHVASFNGSDVDSRKVYEYEGSCR